MQKCWKRRLVYEFSVELHDLHCIELVFFAVERKKIFETECCELNKKMIIIINTEYFLVKSVLSNRGLGMKAKDEGRLRGEC